MPVPDMRPSRGSARPGLSSVTAAIIEDVFCVVRRHDLLARQAGRIGAPLGDGRGSRCDNALADTTQADLCIREAAGAYDA
jgi:hypothetical protein